MAYVIAEPCIGTKDNSCVEVCPVDCIHPTPDEPDYDKVEMLYIDPEECIDCDACVEACPVDACFGEDQRLAGVGLLAQGHGQRHLAQERDVELVGQRLPATLAEEREALPARR